MATKFKRGDRLEMIALLPAEFPDRNWEVACSMVDNAGAGAAHPLQAVLETQETGRAVVLTALPADTATWPLGRMTGDVQFTDADDPTQRISSKDFSFIVVADRTV